MLNKPTPHIWDNPVLSLPLLPSSWSPAWLAAGAGPHTKTAGRKECSVPSRGAKLLAWKECWNPSVVPPLVGIGYESTIPVSCPRLRLKNHSLILFLLGLWIIRIINVLLITGTRIISPLPAPRSMINPKRPKSSKFEL
jgi:hypothetical protein